MRCLKQLHVVLKSTKGRTEMNKKMKAALAGLAFVAGCEIGIAIQLVKMIHTFTIKESAANADADYPEEAMEDTEEGKEI